MKVIRIKESDIYRMVKMVLTEQVGTHELDDNILGLFKGDQLRRMIRYPNQM